MCVCVSCVRVCVTVVIPGSHVGDGVGRLFLHSRVSHVADGHTASGAAVPYNTRTGLPDHSCDVTGLLSLARHVAGTCCLFLCIQCISGLAWTCS